LTTVVHAEGPAEQLTRARASTAARIAAMLRERDGIVDSAALSATDDEHDPEGATLAFEREQLSALLSAAATRLAELDAALRRVTDGSYGRCFRCRDAIPAGRLLARPETTTCIACASSRQ
jgi:DnaK suppressor protein